MKTMCTLKYNTLYLVPAPGVPGLMENIYTVYYRLTA